MQIQFVAGVATITSDPGASSELYLNGLGLPLKSETGYLSTEALGGVKHFGVWPLASAAQSCFGEDTWPEHLPVPQATIEFELRNVAALHDAVAELSEQGFEFIHAAKEEPWGQTLARLLSPEGLLIGLSYTPWLHGDQASS